LVERQTRYVIIKKLKRATKKEVIYGIIEALRKYEVMSITSDNGSEFAGLKIVGNYLGCLVFRCHPYCSWEK
jgi:IS30 family transposase